MFRWILLPLSCRRAGSASLLLFSVLPACGERPMSSFVLIQFGAPVLAALAGGAAGWWLRGRPTGKVAKPPELPQKKVAAQVLQSLQAAAETVRSCVEQHTECIRTIKSELNEASSTEPVIITKLAESIIESNGLVQHQCNDIRKTLHSKRQEIRDCLANSDRLLFTFASLDRQEHAYRQVLVVAGSAGGRAERRDQGARAAAAKDQRRPGKRLRQHGRRDRKCRDANPRRHGRRSAARRRDRAADRGAGRKRRDAGDSHARRSADVAAEPPGTGSRAAAGRRAGAAIRRWPR